MTAPPALSDVLPDLRCTICAAELRFDGNRVQCVDGHTFDVARQGYLNLAVGSASGGTGDTAAMVQARADFLARGHYRPIADAIVADLPDDAQLVADLGGGTGYYLSAALDAVPAAHGVCLDRSTAALRRAVRAHPHGAAIGCDVWSGIPLADGRADVVLDVFSPRNGAEIRRVLAPDGRLIVVTPTARHLHEIIEPLGMLSVDERKTDRLTENLRDFSVQDRRTVEYPIELDRRATVDLVSMGPAAWHSTPEVIAQRTEALPVAVRVTVSVDVATLGVDE